MIFLTKLQVLKSLMQDLKAARGINPCNLEGLEIAFWDEECGIYSLGVQPSILKHIYDNSEG